MGSDLFIKLSVAKKCQLFLKLLQIEQMYIKTIQKRL